MASEATAHHSPTAALYNPNPEEATAFPLYAATVTWGVTDTPRLHEGLIHWHHDLQFMTVIDGHITVETSAGKLDCTAGCTVFLNVDAPHRIARRERGTYAYVLIPVRMLGFFPGSAMEAERVKPYTAPGADSAVLLDGSEPWHAEVARLVLATTEAIADAHAGGSAYHAALGVLQLWATFTDHARFAHLGGGQDRTSSRIRAFVSYIQEHFGEQITIDDIAAAGNVSRVECGRCFRTAFSTSPYRYLTEYRLERASDLLRGSDTSVTDIALACGFGSSSHFSNVFRAQTGVSPRAYRKQKNSRLCAI